MMIKKILYRFLVLFAIMLIGYAIYPPFSTGPITLEYPTLEYAGDKLEKIITERERHVENIKPDNEAQFFWADSTKSKTEYAIVYLHGFSASHYEGFPTHINIAKRYGMNLFLSRLANHGISGVESMNDLTADKLADSAMEAIAIGKQMGEKVILMGCSTGGTVGLMAMAHDPTIEGAILYSPNIELANPASILIRKPFGKKLAAMIEGRDHHQIGSLNKLKKYWTNRYRFHGIQVLLDLMAQTMTPKTFQKITQPVLSLTYYEDETHQDKVISVEAVEEMMNQIGTPSSKKTFKKLPSVKAHVMSCELQSSDLEVVFEETVDFIENVMKIAPMN